jgi:ribosome recycling factor
MAASRFATCAATPIEHIKKAAKGGGISRKMSNMPKPKCRKLTDQYIGKIDQHLATKEKEILTV